MCLAFFDMKLTLGALLVLYGLSTVLSILKSPRSLGDFAPILAGYLFVFVGGLFTGIGFISSTAYQIYRGFTAKELAVIERELPYTTATPQRNSWANFKQLLLRKVEPSEIGAIL